MNNENADPVSDTNTTNLDQVPQLVIQLSNLVTALLEKHTN